MKLLSVLIRLLLLPVSLLYGLVTEIRNLLFHLKWLPIYHSKLAVISVGNLTAGGTGKTPFTIWLAGQLANEYQVAVVSRGYRRKTKGLKVVANRGQISASPEEVGDEPFLIARKLKNVTVLVVEKRKQALQWLEQNCAAQVVILDDGFQHRHVHRDVEIILFKRAWQFYFNFILPTGSWREFPWHIRRAHFVVLPEKQQLPFIRPQNQFQVKARSQMLVDCYFKPIKALQEMKGEPVAVFAGIAQPELFFKQLNDLELKVARSFSFKDHHHFSKKDIEKMFDVCRQEKIKYLLCTEKDLVKVCNLLQEESSGKMEEVTLAAVDYYWQVLDGERLVSQIKKAIDKKLKKYYINDSI